MGPAGLRATAGEEVKDHTPRYVITRKTRRTMERRAALELLRQQDGRPIFFLEREQRDRLELAGKDLGLDLGAMMNEALRLGLEALERKAAKSRLVQVAPAGALRKLEEKR